MTRVERGGSTHTTEYTTEYGTRQYGTVWTIVDRIMDRRPDARHGFLYKVRWQGYGAAHDTWEPPGHFNKASLSLIEDYNKLHPLPKPVPIAAALLRKE